jgi:transposase
MVTREVRMDIVMLKRQGLRKRQIAKRMGIHLGTVSGYLERGGQSSRHPPRRAAAA